MLKFSDRSAAAKLGWQRRRERERQRTEREKEIEWFMSHVTSDARVPPGMVMIFDPEALRQCSTTEVEVKKPMSP